MSHINAVHDLQGQLCTICNRHFKNFYYAKNHFRDIHMYEFENTPNLQDLLIPISINRRNRRR